MIQDQDPVTALTEDLRKLKFKQDIKNMFFEASKNRRRTIFIESIVKDPEEIPQLLAKLTWKNLTRLQKINKIREYLKVNKIDYDINLKTVCGYKISKIIFDNTTQRVTSLNIEKN